MKGKKNKRRRGERRRKYEPDRRSSMTNSPHLCQSRVTFHLCAHFFFQLMVSLGGGLTRKVHLKKKKKEKKKRKEKVRESY